MNRAISRSKDCFLAVNLIGIGIQAQPGSADWKSRIYYPGVRARDLAVPVDIGSAQESRHLNLQLPDETAP